MRLLLVEDDKKIAAFVISGLKQEGFIVDHADNGLDGYHLASTESYEAAVIDVMLPQLSGLELIQGLRRDGNLLPVLILSAKDAIDDRIKGLQSGSDDYLTKPFSFAELVARIQALIRRANAIAEPTSLSVRDLHLDLLRRKVSKNEIDIDLQPKEFSLLEYLVRNKGRVVSKIMLMENVWGYDFEPQTNVVESRISRLREKVDVAYERPLIRTIRGAGYVIEE